MGGIIIRAGLGKYKGNKSIIYNIINILVLTIFFVISVKTKIDIKYMFILTFAIILNLLAAISTYKSSIKNNKNLIKYHCNKAIKNLLREQRHDYMNVFQIIYGYLQLKKSDKAIEQIKKVTSITNNISETYNITVPSISLLLDKKIREANNQGLVFTCNIKTSKDETIRIIKNESEIINKLNDIFDLLIDSLNDNQHNILVDIWENNKGIKFIFNGNFVDRLRNKDNKLLKNYSINKHNIKITFDYRHCKNIDSKIDSYLSTLFKM